ncbi:MAG: class I SAM-dependent methyltransferase [Deltaproteobacteria bacterium]|nr:class I SAM-dependent methyltransferase [Deltaproteobacteria bacterium]
MKEYAPNSKVLDVGCSDGGWLCSLGSSWERYGIEPASIGHFPDNIFISNTTLEKAVFKNNFFGAVTLFDVVEHLHNPIDIFEKIHRYLTPGGIVIVETGDIMSCFAKFMKNRWSYAAIPSHVSFFTYQSIKKAFSLSNIDLIYYKKIHRPTRSRFSRKLIQAIKAFGYRAFSGGVEALPETKKVYPIKYFYEYKPPDFLFSDHFIAVGRKE